MPKERLSAGEKQLMVVSLLWALAICSRRKLPVIIDTPLSRLDSKHRMALLQTYVPNASDQTNVLSTDSEIYGKYYKAIKENVGNEYTLDYDDEKNVQPFKPDTGGRRNNDFKTNKIIQSCQGAAFETKRTDRN